MFLSHIVAMEPALRLRLEHHQMLERERNLLKLSKQNSFQSRFITFSHLNDTDTLQSNC